MTNDNNFADSNVDKVTLLKSKIADNERKLDNIRKINITATCIAFIMHMIGLALFQPIIVIAALCLLAVNIVTSPKFFRLNDIDEQLKAELEKEMLISDTNILISNEKENLIIEDNIKTPINTQIIEKNNNHTHTTKR